MTVKIDSSTHERLARIAAERGTTIEALIEHFAATTPTRPTRAELAERKAADIAYIRANLIPDFDDDDVAAGKRMLEAIRAGRDLSGEPFQ